MTAVEDSTRRRGAARLGGRLTTSWEGAFPISPADMLLEQLRVQLWPTPLEVTGAEHLREVEAGRTGPSWQLDRARDRIWLIQLADGLAVALQRAFPVDALGRRPH